MRRQVGLLAVSSAAVALRKRFFLHKGLSRARRRACIASAGSIVPLPAKPKKLNSPGAEKFRSTDARKVTDTIVSVNVGRSNS